MADEPPVSPETPTPTPEKKSHTGLIVTIVLIVIVVLLALFFGLYFGLRNKGDDIPDEVNPDPEIVEPGPVEEPDGGNDGDEEPVATSISVLGADDLVIYYSTTGDQHSTSINLRETLTVTVYDQFGVEYTGNGGSEYTLSTLDTGIISLDDTKGIVSALRAGEAHITITSIANENIFTDITITVEDLDIEVTSISVSLSGETSNEGNILLDWGATSSELEVTFEPTDATVQTYEVTPKLDEDDDVLFTYSETTHTFTHTKLNTGTQTFVITATDQSNEASATITLECDPVIDEPYEVVWKSDPSLPETIAKGESIDNLDDYVEVHYNHGNQDPNEYVDDTYTLSFAVSNGAEIDEDGNISFTGSGGTQVYITVTATPEHDEANPVYAVSSGITITQAVTRIDINCSEYMFKPLKSVTPVDLEVTFYPEDAYPLPEEQITWTVTDDSSGYINVTPNEEDSSKCEVSLVEGAKIDKDQYIESTVVASVGNVSASCNIIISTYDFATDSWDTINNVSSQGIASKVYDVGDTKENVSINSEDHTIRIIDFDHDDLTTNDNSYNNDSGKAGITCEMVDCLLTTHKMNSSATNVGGWYSCGMRSYLNSDSGCVLSTLDSDLQSVIKKVDKKSTKGGSSTELGTTASDSLFLLAEVELDGTENDGYKDEGTQYAYYSEHTNNSDRIKNLDGSAKAWWLRTPRPTVSSGFRFVTTSGSFGGNDANGTRGVSFGFCI